MSKSGKDVRDSERLNFRNTFSTFYIKKVFVETINVVKSFKFFTV